jgi:hypothetical protein
MISIMSGYAIVDERDNIWTETIASSRKKSWDLMGRGCCISKTTLLKRGFKCVRVDIQTEEYKRGER